MTTKELLKCNITDAGSMFTVGESIKDTTFPPGTLGFTSFIQGPDYEIPNIVFQQVVTIRRGKGGKPRLNTNTLLCPIFPLFPEHKKKVFTTDEERKYFVDLELVNPPLCNLTDPNKVPSIEFMGWVLARALFVKELDKANYPPNNEIMQAIGLGGGKQMNVWKTTKTSILSEFITKAERYFNDGMEDRLEMEFCLPGRRAELLKDLAQKESCLAIPRLEYTRRVTGVIKAALEYTKSIFENDKDKLKLNKATFEFYKANEMRCKSFIDTRISRIKKNREILQM